MPRRDRTHDIARRALERDGWTITHDPYPIRLGDLAMGCLCSRYRGDRIVDRIMTNKRACRQLVESLANYWQPNDGTQTKAIIDDQAGCYQVINSGQLRGRPVNVCFMHLEVDDSGTVQIVKNDTEWEIDGELRDLGVVPDDIKIVRHTVELL